MLLSVSIESEGPYTPERMLPEAVKVMRQKITAIRKAAQGLMADKSDAGAVPPPKAKAGADGDEDVEMGEA